MQVLRTPERQGRWHGELLNPCFLTYGTSLLTFASENCWRVRLLLQECDIRMLYLLRLHPVIPVQVVKASLEDPFKAVHFEVPGTDPSPHLKVLAKYFQMYSYICRRQYEAGYWV